MWVRLSTAAAERVREEVKVVERAARVKRVSCGEYFKWSGQVGDVMRSVGVQWLSGWAHLPLVVESSSELRSCRLFTQALSSPLEPPLHHHLATHTLHSFSHHLPSPAAEVAHRLARSITTLPCSPSSP